jgi:hypothetical protein
MANLTDFYAGGALATHDLDKVIHNQNYTFALGDQNSKLHVSTDSSAYTWTIPLNSSVAFPDGSIFTLYNEGSGDITVTASVGVTLREAGTTNSGTDFIINQYGLATVIKIGTDEWIFSGGVASISRAQLAFFGRR